MRTLRVVGTVLLLTVAQVVPSVAQDATWVVGPLHLRQPEPVPDSLKNEVPLDTLRAGTFAVARRNTISVYDLAAAWAPTLWFSDHEPHPGTHQLPSKMEHDKPPQPAEAGVVYYRAVVVKPRPGLTDAYDAFPGGDEPKNPKCPESSNKNDPTPDCLHLDKIDFIRLQYLFYFEKDFGGGEHPHDLERAELWFRVNPLEGDSLHRVELDRIVGYAHGHKAFANQLKLHPDRGEPLRVPIVFLLELGKHAPAPDRTMDGRFTPGFDVNIQRGDAWGVRDTFSGKWFGYTSYASWMTLGREMRRQAIFQRDPVTSPSSSWTYQLRDFKPAATATGADSLLLIYLKYHEYDAEPKEGPSHFFDTWDRVGWALRIESRWGISVSFLFWQVPFIPGHLIGTLAGAPSFLKMNWPLDPPTWTSASVFYSPSVVGLFSVYGGMTQRWCSKCSTGRGFGPEAGFKVRLPYSTAPPTPRFVGLRVGLRYVGVWNLRHPQIFLEIGRVTP